MHAHASSLDGVIPFPTPVADPPAPAGSRAGAAPADPPPLPPSFTASLLAGEGAFSAVREAARFGVGLGLAALYGLSLGARQGGKAFFVHAAGVPAALLAVSALGIPALYIILALFDAPIEHPRVIAATARAAARSGLVLAGLAPAAALFVVSSDRTATAAIAGAIGLAVAGMLGLVRLLSELRGALEKAPITTSRALTGSSPDFSS
jgi:hypothetical protein